MPQGISSLWNRIPSAWRFALAAFLVARLALTLWSFVVYWIFPVALQNIGLFGEPVLAVFDLRTGERYAYSRTVDETPLSFRALDDQFMADNQTGSVWSMHDGHAIQGNYSGTSLKPSTFAIENIFPYLGVKPVENIALSLWQRFDANWYLKIAERGYEADGSTVYFPAYPFLIRIFASFMDPMFAALLVSNLSLIGVLGLLHQLTASITTEVAARRAIAYLLLFPTAFFLSSAYTESLFLFFAVASLFAASRGRWSWSVIWGIFSSLTRLQGILLVIPLAWLMWRETKGLALRTKGLRFAPLALIPGTTVLFLAFTNLSLISTYEGTLNAQFVFPWENILASIRLLVDGNGEIVDVLNLVFTFWLIAMMIPIFRLLPLEYFLYTLVMLIAPMLRMTTTQPLVSMMRYALAVFPVFMVLGIWGGDRRVNRVIVYLSLPLLLYLSAQFILWGWVG
jgi:hypothetical protein